MTRINVVPVCELSDQWLLAEYRELPRVITQKINISDAPIKYKLGTGHVKWAKLHSFYCLLRYAELYKEMLRRGFNVNYTPTTLCDKYFSLKVEDHFYYQYYVPTAEDIEVNRKRLLEKYRLKPDYYRWTNCIKPEWLI